MQSIAYKPLISTLFENSTYVGDQHSTFTKLFADICSPESSNDSIAIVQSGCAAFAINFYGDQDKTLSKYEYQPLSDVAFANSLYNDNTLNRMAERPPTRLTQVKSSFLYICI